MVTSAKAPRLGEKLLLVHIAVLVLAIVIAVQVLT
jgi:hypothetical protein